MQKLTYINLHGDTLVFTSAPPYILEHVSGLGRPPIKVLTSRGVWQQGDTPERISLDARIVDLQFHIQGASRADLYAQREALMTALASPRVFDGEKQGRLIYENDHGSWWCYAIPEETNPEKRLQNWFLSAKLPFRCASPYWMTEDTHHATLQMGNGGLRLPFSFPIKLGTSSFSGTVINQGQVDAPLIIDIYGSGETPGIVNHTTGAQLTVSKPVALGETLRMNTDPNVLSVTLIAADGSQTPAHGYLSLDSALRAFVLRPGENQLEYLPSAPSTASRVQLAWQTRLEAV